MSRKVFPTRWGFIRSGIQRKGTAEPAVPFKVGKNGVLFSFSLVQVAHLARGSYHSLASPSGRCLPGATDLPPGFLLGRLPCHFLSCDSFLSDFLLGHFSPGGFLSRGFLLSLWHQ